jgi:hypothetical protein
VRLVCPRAFEAGFFATESMRPLLWEAAYRLFDRLARDPVAQPSPEGASPAWNAAHCSKAVETASRNLAMLARFMGGDLTDEEGRRHGFYVPASYFRLPARSEPSQPVPVTALDVFPQPCAEEQVAEEALPEDVEAPLEEETAHPAQLNFF